MKWTGRVSLPYDTTLTDTTHFSSRGGLFFQSKTAKPFPDKVLRNRVLRVGPAAFPQK